jgi:hypothetical protein
MGWLGFFEMLDGIGFELIWRGQRQLFSDQIE